MGKQIIFNEKRDLRLTTLRRGGTLPQAIRELVLDDQRLRNAKCWFLFDC